MMRRLRRWWARWTEPRVTPAQETARRRALFDAAHGGTATARVPIMITTRMRRDLHQLGWSNVEINRMTPATAAAFIQSRQRADGTR